MKTYTYSIAIILVSIVAWSFALGVSAHGTVECVELNTYLAIGSKDTSIKAVTQLQGFLHAKDYLLVEPTGYYGSLTFVAVKKFQSENGISPLGVVGPLTRAKIKEVSCAPKTPTVSPVESPVAVPTPAPEPVAVQVLPQTASIITSLGVPLPYKTNSFAQWKGAWGSVSHTPEGSLRLKAAPDTTGAEALFRDASDWADYRYTADVVVTNGDITLFARFVDSNNFVSCTFSANNVQIRQRINGETTILVSGLIPAEYPSMYYLKSTTVSMRVKGNTIGCTASGSSDNLTYTTTDAIPLKGAIGIQTWQSHPGNATLELRGVIVEKI